MRSSLLHRSRRVTLGMLSLMMAISPANFCLDSSRHPAARAERGLRTRRSHEEAIKAAAIDSFGKMELAFEPNNGQVDNRVRFLSRGRGYSLFLTNDEAVLSIASRNDINAAVRMKAVGANPRPEIMGEARQQGRSNYFIGNDQSKWRQAPHYGRVRYDDIYRGIDLIYYGKQGQLEYDFVVDPGADPKKIKLHFDGVEQLKVDTNGDLIMQVAAGEELKQCRPVAYQEINGKRLEVEARFDLRGKGEVAFELGAYDHTRALIIDPVLLYSSFIGHIGEDRASDVAVDKAGNAYLVGGTGSSNFPVTTGAYQTTHNGRLILFPPDPRSSNIFISKLDRDGKTLMYSTFLGGSGPDEGRGIAVDNAGNAYVTGYANSSNFPVTMGAYQEMYAGGVDAFAAKLGPDGDKLLYSTYLGGSSSDYGQRIAIDGLGNSFIAGETRSSDFPVTGGAAYQDMFGGMSDGFVVKLSADGAALSYSSFLGGSDYDYASDIAVDSTGRANVVGVTRSTNFPITAGRAYQDRLKGSSDAFITRLTVDGKDAAFSTFLGGDQGDSGSSIAVDRFDNIYCAGYTTSTNFPTTFGVIQSAHAADGGATDLFFSKLSSDGLNLEGVINFFALRSMVC